LVVQYAAEVEVTYLHYLCESNAARAKWIDNSTPKIVTASAELTLRAQPNPSPNAPKDQIHREGPGALAATKHNTDL